MTFNHLCKNGLLELVPFVSSDRCARCPDRATEVDRAPDRLPKDFRPPKDTSLETIPGDHPGRVFHRAT